MFTYHLLFNIFCLPSLLPSDVYHLMFPILCILCLPYYYVYVWLMFMYHLRSFVKVAFYVYILCFQSLFVRTILCLPSPSVYHRMFTILCILCLPSYYVYVPFYAYLLMFTILGYVYHLMLTILC